MAERLGESFRGQVEARLEQRSFATCGVSVRNASLGGIGGALGAALLVGDLS